MTEQGLRERKKLATRAALIEAAWRLTVERGSAGVRVEDIAAAAGVSTRTFNNYFANKEDALVALGADRADRIEVAFRARPASEPLWRALADALAEGYTGAFEVPRQATAHVGGTPELVALQLRLQQIIEVRLAEAIADRIGLNADRDLYPRLVAATAVAVTRTTFDYWRRQVPESPFPVVLRAALAQVAHGLPTPK
jgi:AcrR family transcriptional regulator